MFLWLKSLLAQIKASRQPTVPAPLPAVTAPPIKVLPPKQLDPYPYDPYNEDNSVPGQLDSAYSDEYTQRLFGASSEPRRREVATLSALLKEVWDARQAGKTVHPRDDGHYCSSKERYLGFVLGDEWVLCQVIGARRQEKIEPEVASLFGITPEDASEFLFDYKLRQWLAGWFPGLDPKALSENEPKARRKPTK